MVWIKFRWPCRRRSLKTWTATVRMDKLVASVASAQIKTKVKTLWEARTRVYWSHRFREIISARSATVATDSRLRPLWIATMLVRQSPRSWRAQRSSTRDRRSLCRHHVSHPMVPFTLAEVAPLLARIVPSLWRRFDPRTAYLSTSKRGWQANSVLGQEKSIQVRKQASC